MSRYIQQKVKKYLNVDSLNESITFSSGDKIEKIELLRDDLDIEELIREKMYHRELLETIQAHCSDLERQAIYLYYYSNLTHLQVKERLQLNNVEYSRTLINRAIRNIRRSSWFAREYKEIKERRVDHRTNWVKAQQYDNTVNRNSHRPFYSSVEELVLQRERIRLSICP